MADADVEDDEMPLGLMLTVGFRKLDNVRYHNSNTIPEICCELRWPSG